MCLQVNGSWLIRSETYGLRINSNIVMQELNAFFGGYMNYGGHRGMGYVLDFH